MAVKKSTKKASIKQEPIRFTIKSISVLDFKNNIPNSIEDINLISFNYKLTANVSVNIQESLLDIVIVYTFFDDTTQYEELSILTRILIVNLQKHLSPENKISDIGFLRYMVDMSITHSRGVHALLVKDTKFDNLLMPPISHNSIDSKIVWT